MIFVCDSCDVPMRQADFILKARKKGEILCIKNLDVTEMSFLYNVN